MNHYSSGEGSLCKEITLIVCAGTDKEEKEEQWLVFQEAIAAKSGRSMPKPSAPSTAGKTSTNFALLSPVKVDGMMSLEALKLEFSLVQNAMKGGHRDKATTLRGKAVSSLSRPPKIHTHFPPKHAHRFRIAPML